MLDIQWVGPPLDAGTYPAVFYFALSAHDSLFVDPFNQPVTHLQSSKMRIFSITLPGHDQLPPTIALQYWADQMKQGLHPVGSFLEDVSLHLQTLFDQKVFDACAVMGLSRGVFIAAHLAARVPFISTLLGFAPLTTLSSVTEFQTMNVQKWDLISLSEKLYSKKIRCYIGNRDTRVGTESCFNWLHTLANHAYEKGIRSPPIELVMTPSIGREGHGTSPQIFQEGASWLLHQLKGSHAT